MSFNISNVGKTNRKRVRSAIITDSPGKKLLISVQSSSVEKSSKKQKTKAGKKLAFSKFASNTNEGSSSKSNEDDIICDVSSEDSSENFSNFDHETAIIPQIGNYVVVKFDDKRLLHFVGQILTDKNEDDDYEVLFLRRHSKCNGFAEPAVDDIHSVSSSDVVMVLPSQCNGTTERTEGIKKSAVDLSTFNL